MHKVCTYIIVCSNIRNWSDLYLDSTQHTSIYQSNNQSISVQLYHSSLHQKTTWFQQKQVCQKNIASQGVFFSQGILWWTFRG